MKKILIILLLSFASQITQAEEVPVEDFFKNADISSMYLSPTGEYLAAVFQQEEKYRIATLDTKTLKPIKVINVSNEKEVSTLQWVNDERFVFTVHKQVGALARPFGTGELLASNYDGTKQTVLPPGLRIVDLMPEDPKVVLALEMPANGYPKVHKLNVYADVQVGSFSKSRAGATFTVFSSPYRGGLILDHNGVPRLGIDDNQHGKQEIYYRSSEDAEWVKINTQREEEKGIRFITFTSDNKSLYIYDETSGKEGIYIYNPETKAKQLLWEDDNVVTPGLRYSNDYYNPVPIGVELHDGVPTAEYFDESDAYSKLLINVQKAFPVDFVDPITTTKDGKLSLLEVRSDKNPGDYYLLDHETSQLRYLASTAPWIKPSEMNARMPISFKARDGLQIHGYLTLPEGKKKDLPMIVLVHGGPYGPRDYWWFDPEAQLFSNRGYAVLQVNFRGSGGYGTEFQYGAYRQMGAEMQDDITDATLWAIEKGIAAEDRICIYGGSYGGYAALMGVVREPDLYQCSVGYVGVYDIKLQEYSDIDEWEGGRYFLDQAWNIKDEKFVKERSAVYHVDKIKAPLMLVHGKADRRVPYSNYQALTSALDDIDYPYESVVETEEGHGFYKLENKKRLYKKMLEFFDKHIGE